MKDRIKETSEATGSKKLSLESHRKEADRLTEARKTSEQFSRDKVERHLKSGNSSLSKADTKMVLDAFEKGAKITQEGTIPLVGDPRRWGGMSGEGSRETDKERYKRHVKEKASLLKEQKKEMEDLIKKMEASPTDRRLVEEFHDLRDQHIEARAQMDIDHEEENENAGK